MVDENKFIQIQKNIQENLGDPIKERTDVENEILGRLQYFQEGYRKRDDSQVENYVKELVDEHIQIIGTNGVYPGELEFTSGSKAAIELFRSDWKYWGDLELYLDHAEISVEENSAWATVFSTVTVDSRNDKALNFEEIKPRVLEDIKNVADMKKERSTLALHQIIKEAIAVLHEFQIGDLFIWPLRISFGFVKKLKKWKIKQIHFSYPVRGFPPVRLEN